MTKAKALRNYLNAAYNLGISAMSHIGVWKEYLKKQYDYDSKASSMAGIYTEMLDHRLFPTGGSGGGSGEPKFSVAFDVSDTNVDIVAIEQDGYYYAYAKFPRNNITVTGDELIHVVTYYGYYPSSDYFTSSTTDPSYLVYDDNYIYVVLNQSGNDESSAIASARGSLLFIQYDLYDIDITDTAISIVGEIEDTAIDDLTNGVTAYNGKVKVPIPHQFSIQSGDIISVGFYNNYTYIYDVAFFGQISNEGLYEAEFDSNNIYLIFSPSITIATDADARAWFVNGVSIGSRNIYKLNTTVVRRTR